MLKVVNCIINRSYLTNNNAKKVQFNSKIRKFMIKRCSLYKENINFNSKLCIKIANSVNKRSN